MWFLDDWLLYLSHMHASSILHYVSVPKSSPFSSFTDISLFSLVIKLLKRHASPLNTVHIILHLDYTALSKTCGVLLNLHVVS